MESQRRFAEVDVDIWKSKLVTSRLTLKRMMMEEFKYELKEKVFEFNPEEEQRVENEWNPQEIPEEVWLMICKKLDVESLLRMFNTCQIFREWLEMLAIPVLFRKVLPILLQNNYVSPNDILKCRLVSKSMCLLVDKFLESKDSWKLVKRDEPHVLESRLPPVKHFITFPVSNEISDHPRNPFVGRTVIVSLCSFDTTEFLPIGEPLGNDDFHPGRLLLPRHHFEHHHEHENEGEDDVNNEDEDLDDDVNNAIFQDEEDLHVNVDPWPGKRLESCGKNIWHLFLEARCVSLNKEIITGSLSHCPNLKTIKIRGSMSINPDNLEGVKRAVENLHLPNLTSLSLPRGCFQGFQDAFVEKFSGQLEEIEIAQDWNVNYSMLDWSNLRVLHVAEIRCPAELRSLYRLKAGKLKKLSVQLSYGENSGKNLQLLLQTIHHFSQLEELKLDCNWQWEITENEVLSLNPLSFPDVCSTSLKKLHLSTGYCDKITYSFLLYFPVLEGLHISYGSPGLDLETNFDDPVWIGNKLKQLVNQEMYRSTQNERSTELIELREYIYINREKIKKSVIWNILPFLKEIKVTGFWRTLGSTCFRSEKFLRSV